MKAQLQRKTSLEHHARPEGRYQPRCEPLENHYLADAHDEHAAAPRFGTDPLLERLPKLICGPVAARLHSAATIALGGSSSAGNIPRSIPSRRAWPTSSGSSPAALQSRMVRRGAVTGTTSCQVISDSVNVARCSTTCAGSDTAGVQAGGTVTWMRGGRMSESPWSMSAVWWEKTAVLPLWSQTTTRSSTSECDRPFGRIDRERAGSTCANARLAHHLVLATGDNPEQLERILHLLPRRWEDKVEITMSPHAVL